MKPNKENIHALEEYLELRELFVAMLQKMKQIGEPLSTSIVQPILKGMIKSSTPEILWDDLGGFTITSE